MKHHSLFILGRQPAIGRAELESLFGKDHVEPIGDGQFAMASDILPKDIPFDRIGGSIRLAEPLDIVPAGKWSNIGRRVIKPLAELLKSMPEEGKVKFGISVYGIEVDIRDLLRTGLEFKKMCKGQNRSVRVVPNVDPTLNSAQVLHNQLTGEMGIELLFIANDKQVYIARTLIVQNIDVYAERDQGRPKRDSFVGMLPPKLAQIIVNLGVSQLTPSRETVVLDPFCGTGVILQEASLMQFGVYGTDLKPRMVDYTKQNLEWLNSLNITASVENIPELPDTVTLETGDATDHVWTQPFSVVASETYLGHPLNNWPTHDKLREIIGTCNVIIQKFLSNISKQLPSGTRLCLAVPAWQAPNGQIHHLPVLDQIEVLGYNRVSFSWASGQDMVYRRPDQLVARELLVIIKE